MVRWYDKIPLPGRYKYNCTSTGTAKCKFSRVFETVFDKLILQKSFIFLEIKNVEQHEVIYKILLNLKKKNVSILVQ